MSGHPDEPGDQLREALRDLLPDYRGPADPYARVGATIRRRRNSRRAWVAVGVAAGAAAAVAVAPALVGVPGPVVPGAPRPAGPAQVEAGVQPVAAGTVAGQRWEVGSTSLTPAARRCLYSDTPPFSRSLACFPEWRPERDASWVTVTMPGGTVRTVTAVLGVAPDSARRVEVGFGDGRTVRADAVRTATDPQARFFALVVTDPGTVRSVTLLDASGAPLAAPDTNPEAPPECAAATDLICAGPTG